MFYKIFMIFFKFFVQYMFLSISTLVSDDHTCDDDLCYKLREKHNWLFALKFKYKYKLCNHNFYLELCSLASNNTKHVQHYQLSIFKQIQLAKQNLVNLKYMWNRSLFYFLHIHLLNNLSNQVTAGYFGSR